MDFDSKLPGETYFSGNKSNPIFYSKFVMNDFGAFVRPTVRII